MKTLGTTLEGKYIVEMSMEEQQTFMELDRVIMSNATYFSPERFPDYSGKDLSKTFIALRNMIDAKMSINRLKEFVNNLDVTFTGQWDT